MSWIDDLAAKARDSGGWGEDVLSVDVTGLGLPEFDRLRWLSMRVNAVEFAGVPPGGLMFLGYIALQDKDRPGEHFLRLRFAYRADRPFGLGETDAIGRPRYEAASFAAYLPAA